jgi:DNA-binding transcriptional ArsR family regulator
MKRDPSQSPNFRSKLSKYDMELDKIIIEILDNCKISKKSGEVKDQVEKLLGRTISPDTYSAHLSNLIKEKIVIKDDKGRGKEILYSLSEYGRKLKKLKLLKRKFNH